MDSASLDRLVETIAERVRSRLESGQSGSRAALCEGCATCMLPDSACNTCGLVPSNALASGFQPPAIVPSPKEMARFIDHTHLKPDANRQTIETICREAREHNFFSVCVNAGNVQLAARNLRGSRTKVCAVVGFPLGASTSGSKAFEAREAVRCGASEIDMVINVGALRSLDYALVVDDIKRVVKAVPGKVVKVILETGMLQPAEKAIGCALAKAAGAHFVKTSTGFGPSGATVEDIQLMRQLVGLEVGVKASGGVRDYATAVKMIQAGANRIGASSSVAVVTGGRGTSGY